MRQSGTRPATRSPTNYGIFAEYSAFESLFTELVASNWLPDLARCTCRPCWTMCEPPAAASKALEPGGYITVRGGGGFVAGFPWASLEDDSLLTDAGTETAAGWLKYARRLWPELSSPGNISSTACVTYSGEDTRIVAGIIVGITFAVCSGDASGASLVR
jgi:hypothetical protein